MPGIGIDIIEIPRIKQAIDRWGETFLRRVYTEPELKLYRKKPESLAARFAAKEAVIKALASKGTAINWQEIEILSGPSGEPYLNLYGETKKKALMLGIDTFAISLSHSREYAIAIVTGEAA